MGAKISGRLNLLLTILQAIGNTWKNFRCKTVWGKDLTKFCMVLKGILFCLCRAKISGRLNLLEKDLTKFCIGGHSNDKFSYFDFYDIIAGYLFIVSNN
jgi:hypothetical protein